jgi:hypothetical protein
MEGLKFPKTVIITVTTHGRIPLDKKGQPAMFTLPPGMTLTKISSVVPGVCNIMSSDDSDYYNEILIHWLKTREEEPSSGTFTQKVVGFLRKEDKENIMKEVEKNVRQKKRELELEKERQKMVSPSTIPFEDEYEEDEDEDDEGEDMESDIRLNEAYLNAFDKNYPVSVFENMRKKSRTIPASKKVINKQYIREESTEQFESPWDFKISVLNVVGYPDLMRLMVGRTHYGTSVISLEEIVKMLNEKGVRNILLVDFSCSVLQDETDVVSDPDERTIRIMRRELFKMGMHGGKLGKKSRRSRRRKSSKRKHVKHKKHRKTKRKERK